eukprot:m.246911 g.246911  ORF g.246911 m.246911 type:complete len:1308 (+) comp17154_c2_seq6:307-4230(+)
MDGQQPGSPRRRRSFSPKFLFRKTRKSSTTDELNDSFSKTSTRPPVQASQSLRHHQKSGSSRGARTLSIVSEGDEEETELALHSVIVTPSVSAPITSLATSPYAQRRPFQPSADFDDSDSNHEASVESDVGELQSRSAPLVLAHHLATTDESLYSRGRSSGVPSEISEMDVRRPRESHTSTETASWQYNSPPVISVSNSRTSSPAQTPANSVLEDTLKSEDSRDKIKDALASLKQPALSLLDRTHSRGRSSRRHMQQRSLEDTLGSVDMIKMIAANNNKRRSLKFRAALSRSIRSHTQKSEFFTLQDIQALMTELEVRDDLIPTLSEEIMRENGKDGKIHALELASCLMQHENRILNLEKPDDASSSVASPSGSLVGFLSPELGDTRRKLKAAQDTIHRLQEEHAQQVAKLELRIAELEGNESTRHRHVAAGHRSEHTVEPERRTLDVSASPILSPSMALASKESYTQTSSSQLPLDLVRQQSHSNSGMNDASVASDTKPSEPMSTRDKITSSHLDAQLVPLRDARVQQLEEELALLRKLLRQEGAFTIDSTSELPPIDWKQQLAHANGVQAKLNALQSKNASLERAMKQQDQVYEAHLALLQKSQPRDTLMQQLNLEIQAQRDYLNQLLEDLDATKTELSRHLSDNAKLIVERDELRIQIANTKTVPASSLAAHQQRFQTVVDAYNTAILQLTQFHGEALASIWAEDRTSSEAVEAHMKAFEKIVKSQLQQLSFAIEGLQKHHRSGAIPYGDRSKPLTTRSTTHATGTDSDARVGSVADEDSTVSEIETTYNADSDAGEHESHLEAGHHRSLARPCVRHAQGSPQDSNDLSVLGAAPLDISEDANYSRMSWDMGGITLHTEPPTLMHQTASPPSKLNKDFSPSMSQAGSDEHQAPTRAKSPLAAAKVGKLTEVEDDEASSTAHRITQWAKHVENAHDAESDCSDAEDTNCSESHGANDEDESDTGKQQREHSDQQSARRSSVNTSSKPSSDTLVSRNEPNEGSLSDLPQRTRAEANSLSSRAYGPSVELSTPRGAQQGAKQSQEPRNDNYVNDLKSSGQSMSSHMTQTPQDSDTLVGGRYSTVNGKRTTSPSSSSPKHALHVERDVAGSVDHLLHRDMEDMTERPSFTSVATNSTPGTGSPPPRSTAPRRSQSMSSHDVSSPWRRASFRLEVDLDRFERGGLEAAVQVTEASITPARLMRRPSAASPRHISPVRGHQDQPAEFFNHDHDHDDDDDDTERELQQAKARVSRYASLRQKKSTRHRQSGRFMRRSVRQNSVSPNSTTATPSPVPSQIQGRSTSPKLAVV